MALLVRFFLFDSTVGPYNSCYTPWPFYLDNFTTLHFLQWLCLWPIASLGLLGINREVKCHLILPYSTIGPYLTINPTFLVPMSSSHPNGSSRTPRSYRPSTALRRTSSSTFYWSFYLYSSTALHRTHPQLSIGPSTCTALQLYIGLLGPANPLAQALQVL